MNSKDIIICIKPELADRVRETWHNQDTSILGECFPANIQLVGLKPMLPTLEQIEYLERIGSKQILPKEYRIYIGNDVEEITERHGGVELPASILDDNSLFYKEVIFRIRNIIGSLYDN